jgi:hypothetical protein
MAIASKPIATQMSIAASGQGFSSSRKPTVEAAIRKAPTPQINNRQKSVQVFASAPLAFW